MFSAPSSSGLLIVLIDSTDPGSGYNPGLGLASGAMNYFAGVFSTATPTYSAGTPTSSTLSGFLTMVTNYFPVTILLVGITGGLVINDFGSATPTASIAVASVPEPSGLVLAGTALLAGLGGLFRRHCRRITEKSWVCTAIFPVDR
jgi:hypothetical protein